MIRNYTSFRNSSLGPLVAMCLALAAGSSAFAQHADVFLTNVGGAAAIGSASDEPPHNPDLSTRVFEGVMIAGFPPLDPADYGRDEPGFFALPAGHAEMPAGASALPGGAAATINLPAFTIGAGTDSLFYWNGLGAVDFQPISTSQPGVGMALDPNPIGMTGPMGSFDLHPDFRLDNGGAGVPDDGVYLIRPTASVAGLTDSGPFYIVWLVDALLADDEAAEELEMALEMGQFVVHGKDFGFFEEAVEYVQQNLVPEPAGAVLILSAFVAFGTFPRRDGRNRRAET
jgi:hypothetical protein